MSQAPAGRDESAPAGQATGSESASEAPAEHFDRGTARARALGELAAALLPVPLVLLAAAFALRDGDRLGAASLGLLVAAALACAVQAMRRVHFAPIPMSDRIGNGLSRYFEHAAVAAGQGRTLVVLPGWAPSAWLQPLWPKRLPLLAPRRSAPPAKHAYSKHAHQNAEGALFGDLEHSRRVVQSCFEGLALPERRTCTIHMRLGDILYKGHRLYGHPPFEWYVEHIPADCEQVRVVSTSSLPEEREFLGEFARFLASHGFESLQLTSGSIDDDFRALMECHKLLGSVSTFALWAAVGCLGEAVLPQSLLFGDGMVRVLREHPRLEIARTDLVAAYDFRHSEAGFDLLVSEEQPQA